MTILRSLLFVPGNKGEPRRPLSLLELGLVAVYDAFERAVYQTVASTGQP